MVEWYGNACSGNDREKQSLGLDWDALARNILGDWSQDRNCHSRILSEPEKLPVQYWRAEIHQNLAPVLVILSGNPLVFSRKNFYQLLVFYWCCAPDVSAPAVIINESPILGGLDGHRFNSAFSLLVLALVHLLVHLAAEHKRGDRHQLSECLWVRCHLADQGRDHRTSGSLAMARNSRQAAYPAHSAFDRAITVAIAIMMARGLIVRSAVVFKLIVLGRPDLDRKTPNLRLRWNGDRTPQALLFCRNFGNWIEVSCERLWLLIACHLRSLTGGALKTLTAVLARTGAGSRLTLKKYSGAHGCVDFLSAPKP